ncbi:D-cysteine desulfhydrase family protein [uncultured Oscillibacter sp.]|uniref:1-aminocyclopropane-1-carboxylate deaminase/D-cysteine desulfhydrase n=1 Tax=uncultured Oscillibacter sp. TaxID=876091 RepID=UPI002804F100|nr:D-cysteine desulfhydrase family protein [uncultured Oscillibacter sp.]
MQTLTFPPRQSLGLYPTPLQHLDTISARYGRDIWIKRDDLCGVALGGNKVRKLEFLLAQAKAQGCDTVITTGGAQSNHAMLTAACAARLGMQAVLLLKARGVMERRGNLVLDDLYGARVRFVDTDSYDDIHAQARQLSLDLEKQGHRAFWIPLGGSTPLGSLGYVECVRELAEQAQALGFRPGHLVCATGSGGTAAGLFLGASQFLPGAQVHAVCVDHGPFRETILDLAAQASDLLGCPAPDPAALTVESHVGPGYAVPAPEDSPRIRELAQAEGMLLDPVYTGKAWSGMLDLLEQGAFDDRGDLVFLHTGGAAALFAMDLA